MMTIWITITRISPNAVPIVKFCQWETTGLGDEEARLANTDRKEKQLADSLLGIED